MINRAKNVCYVILVPYHLGERFNTNYKYQKFLSLHQARTKTFIEFRDRYFREVLNVPRSNIGEWDKMEYTTAEQTTVSWKQWKDEALREIVLDGITDREKCW